MTINGAIAVVNFGIAFTLAGLAGAAFWQARPYWREWPPGFLIAVGGWFSTLFLTFGQIALFRWTGLGSPFGANEVGTLGLRVACLLLSLALLRRLVTGTLATNRDRLRSRGGTG